MSASAASSLLALKVKIYDTKQTSAFEQRGSEIATERALDAFCETSRLKMPAYPSTLNLGLPGIHLLNSDLNLLERASIVDRRVGHPFVDALYRAHMSGAGFVLSPSALWNLVHDGIALYFQTRPSQYGRAGFEQMNRRMRDASQYSDGIIRITLDARCKDGDNETCSALPVLCEGNAAVWHEMKKKICNVKAHLINSEPVFGPLGEPADLDDNFSRLFGSNFRADGVMSDKSVVDKSLLQRFACNVISPRIAAQDPSVRGVLDDTVLPLGDGIAAYYLTGKHQDWCVMMNQLLLKAQFRPLRAWLNQVMLFIAAIIGHYRSLDKEKDWPTLAPNAEKFVAAYKATHTGSIATFLRNFFRVVRDAESPFDYKMQQVRLRGHFGIFFPHETGIFSSNMGAMTTFFDEHVEEQVVCDVKILSDYITAQLQTRGFDVGQFQNRLCVTNMQFCDSVYKADAQMVDCAIGYYVHKKHMAFEPTFGSFVIFQNVTQSSFGLAKEVADQIYESSLRELAFDTISKNHHAVMRDVVYSDQLRIAHTCDYMANLDAMAEKKFQLMTSKVDTADPATRQDAQVDLTVQVEADNVVQDAVEQGAKDSVPNSDADIENDVVCAHKSQSTPATRSKQKSAKSASKNTLSTPSLVKSRVKVNTKKKVIKSRPIAPLQEELGWQIVGSVRGKKAQPQPASTCTDDKVTTLTKEEVKTSSIYDTQVWPNEVKFFKPVVEPIETVVKPIEAEPTKSEPIEAEPTKSEPIEAEPTKSEPIDAEPTKSEPIDAEPVESAAEPIDAKQALIFGSVAAVDIIDESAVQYEVKETASLDPGKAIQLVRHFLRDCVHPSVLISTSQSNHCCAGHRDFDAAPPCANKGNKTNTSLSLHEALLLSCDTMMRCAECYKFIHGAAPLPKGEFIPLIMQTSQIMMSHMGIVSEFASTLYDYILCARGGTMIKSCMICKCEFNDSSKALSVITQGVDQDGNICARLMFHCGEQVANENQCCLVHDIYPSGLACTIYSPKTPNSSGTDVRVHARGNFQVHSSDLLLRMPTI